MNPKPRRRISSRRILYSSRRPHHPKRKRSARAIFKPRLVRFFFFLGVLVSVGILVFIIIAGKFSVQEINVYAENDAVFDPNLAALIRQHVVEHAEENSRFLKNSIFFLDASEVESEILQSFPRAADVTIVKKYLPRIIEISFREREATGIWCNVKLRALESTGEEGIPSATGEETGELPAVVDECYYVDREGVIFQEAPLSRGFLMTIIRDYGNYPDLRLGMRPLSVEDAQFIFQTRDHFKTELPMTGIKELLYESGEITAVTDKGLRIYLNRSYGPAKNVAVIREILNKSQEGTEVFDYLDLRITNKAYYK